MMPGQYVRRADGTIWQVAHMGTTIRTQHPGMAGETIGEYRLHRDGVDAYVLQYGVEQARRLRLPTPEHLTIVRDHQATP